VLFDGAHSDSDSDLMHEQDRILAKIDGRKPVLIHCTAIVTAALVDQPPLTMREIATVAKTTLQVVNTALYNLRLQGRLGSTLVTGAGAGKAWALKRYWLKSADRL
jgi:hypothetical protein